MFKAERLQRIKTLVYDRKQVDVSSLSALLNVTEVTIRSDLEQLEREGYLKRLHGGAVLNETHSGAQEPSDFLSGHSIVYDSLKEEIAKLASTLITDNDHIFLGSGETCYYIAKELTQRKRLTVLTNNLYVANVLSGNLYINLTLTGGPLVQGRYCTAGDMFRKLTENLYLTKSFFSASGVDMLAGYTVDNAAETEIFRAIAARSRECIMVVDQRKFDNLSFVKMGDLNLFKTVVSNPKLPKDYAVYFKKNGISLLSSQADNPAVERRENNA